MFLPGILATSLGVFAILAPQVSRVSAATASTAGNGGPPCELCNDNGTFYECNPKSLQCRICSIIIGSEPIRCYALNDTFDGASPGHKITRPSRATYTGLKTGSPGPKSPIQPTSHKRFAVSSTGSAMIDFSDVSGGNWWPWATLLSFDFACSSTAKKGAEPVACTLNVTSSCVNETFYGYYADDPLVGSDVYGYAPVVPGGQTLAGMQGVSWTPPQADYDFFGTLCYNYSFVATKEDGGAAVLYLDNVLYKGWTYIG